MSFSVTKTLPFHQTTLNFTYNTDYNSENDCELFTIGGVLLDSQHVWQAKGPHLEIRNTKKGLKVGSWTFGCILRDSNTKIVDVKELQKSNGKLTLLVVALDCTISGGIICLFNVFSSKVIRAIHIKEKISSLYVIDSGVEVLNLPGPLHDFDGILSVGTEGGNVFLIDLCRQICEDSLTSLTVRDELLPCQLTILTPADVSKIYHYREKAVHKGNHLAVHLNAILEDESEHFTLKGPSGDNRIHVNREEVCTSAIYYCNQLTSLLVGFNFGAFQMWDLTSLKLVYTSPVCDEHIPITQFTLQEPTDDPRAFCYVWVSFSNIYLYQTGLPFAVMYALCYESKEYHEGYGHLYQNFQYCAIRFQVELGSLLDVRSEKPAKGGICLGLQSVSKLSSSKDCNNHISTGETLALCVVSWTIWYAQNKTQSNAFIFDLNQWYKEQMPTFSKWANCNNYILRINLSDLTSGQIQKPTRLLNVKMDENSLKQFIGIQRLEEHFYPTSLTFDLWLLRETEVCSIHSEGLQRAVLNQIQTEGPLCLLRPTDIFHRLISLGLTPLFSDFPVNVENAIDIQREIILNVALEHHLLNWLCRTASEWANGRFSSAGCSIDFLLKWAFQRAITLKTNCDRFCVHLFDYSQLRLDNNTSILLNSCTGQIKALYKFYLYLINNLSEFILYIDLAEEQKNSLEMVSTYFEVLQWLVNVGLLPECHPSAYPRPDNSERISAPYPVTQLVDYYNEKRANLQLLSKEQFANSDSLLFIDNLISHKCGAELLQKQWQEDGGSGLYPPRSLQSLLRTYLIPNASICQKHSLMIYLFLDLAMALDQRKYSPVITYLIKFPAVFKVTPSIIKITQAFWQLDHGDYSTAIEQLLDPFVLKEDLQSWHHNVAMRSLLVQNQHKAALRYMQVKTPPMIDETSILTAISLYVTNNMVTEAFDFMKDHCQRDEDFFLMHLFNECNKNKSLNVLLYKCLNGSEEKAFLKYLENIAQPNSKDLRVFYFLLRSRFLEAFDAHSKISRKDPNTQGLIGQQNATHADQIVRIFKNSLPDVNRNLVDYIRKEKNNLWKNVPRPTPLSVFVHDTQEQIKYKSTVIHAAISKAKNTFQETTKTSPFNEVLTEETPFLRTPVAFKNSKRHYTPIITPKVIAVDDGEEMGPSPPKRLKLSPRLSTGCPSYKTDKNDLIHNKMLTPIVKRKTSLEHKQTSESQGKINLSNLQSILKTKQERHLEETTLGEEELDLTAKTPLRSSYNILPRRSISKSRQHVQFEDAAKYSSSFSEQSLSQKQENNASFDEKLHHLSSKDASTTISSINSMDTSEEFYSPNASVEDKNSTSKEDDDKSESDNKNLKEIDEVNNVNKEVEVVKDEEPKLIQSPRARRSYKRSLGEMSPIRSSPRLSRLVSNLRTKSETSINESNTSKFASISETNLTDTETIEDTKKELEESTRNDSSKSNSPPNSTISTSPGSSFVRSPRSPKILQPVKGRKSLSRKVLEHNSFLRMQKTSFIQERILSKTDKSTVIESSLNVTKNTDIDSVEEGPSYSERNTISSGSILKQQSSRYSLRTHDTSTESSASFKYESDAELDELKLSESLVEFVNTIQNTKQIPKNDNSTIKVSNKTQNVDQDIPKESSVLETTEPFKTKLTDPISTPTKTSFQQFPSLQGRSSINKKKITESPIIEPRIPFEPKSTDQVSTPIPQKENSQKPPQRFSGVQGRSSISKANFTRKSILEMSKHSTVSSDEQRLPRSSFSAQKGSLYSPATPNTSTESANSFQYDSDTTPHELKYSDSLIEFVSGLNYKNNNKTTEESTPVETMTEVSITISDASTSIAPKVPNEIQLSMLSIPSSESYKETERKSKSPASSDDAQISEEDEPTKNVNRQVYEDISSGTEDIAEVLTERQDKQSGYDTSYQLDVRMESQEIITLDSTDESEDKQSRSSSDEEEEQGILNQGAILEEDAKVVSPKTVDEVVEIQSSDSETEEDQKEQNVEERQEVSLYSQLEESSSEEEDFSLVYKDMEDETQTATQALEAEMNEPTYNFEHVSDDVFENMEKEVAIIQPQPEKECDLQASHQNIVEKPGHSRIEEKTLKRSTDKQNVQSVGKGKNKNFAFKEGEIKKKIDSKNEEKDHITPEDVPEYKSKKNKKENNDSSNVIMDITVEKDPLSVENIEKTQSEKQEGILKQMPLKNLEKNNSRKESLENISKGKSEIYKRGDTSNAATDSNIKNVPLPLEKDEKVNTSKVEAKPDLQGESNIEKRTLETQSKKNQTGISVIKPQHQNDKLTCGPSETSTTDYDANAAELTFEDDVINKKPSIAGKLNLKTHVSTNTTVLSENENSKTTDRVITDSSEKYTNKTCITVNTKLEESINTSVSTSKEIPVNIQKTGDELTVSIVKKQSAEKTYKSKASKNVMTDETNTSSSDTTEGEIGRQDIVVTAQVHSPSRKKVEEPLIKRITRRRSQLLSQDDKIESLPAIDANISLDGTERKENVTIDLQAAGLGHLTLRGTKTGKSLSTSSKQRKGISTRRSSHSDISAKIDIDCKPSTSKETVKDLYALKLTRRTRSASVDEIKTYSKNHNLRSTKTFTENDTIIEEETAKPKTKMKALSVSDMNNEVTNSKTRKRGTANSALKSYTVSRRLTRNQAEIIKGIPTLDVEDDSELEEPIEADTFNTIKLLDKEPFEGEPDPEERKVYEQSSPSTSSVCSTSKTRKITRTSSITSDIGGEEISPKKRRSVTRSETGTPVKSTIRTRRKSDASSIVSQQSEQDSPPKRTRRKQDEEVASNISASSRTSKRSRTSSVDLEDYPTSVSKKNSRKRILSAKKELPKITEEKVNDSITSEGSSGSRTIKTRSKK